MHKATEYAASVVCSMYILSEIWNVHILSDRDAGRKLWQYREYRQRDDDYGNSFAIGAQS